MSRITLLIGFFFAASGSIQAHAWEKVEGIGKAGVKGVATVQAEWIKPKKDKYDVSMRMTNETKQTILFFVGDMKCARGGNEGGNVDIHSDRRTIDLRAGESRSVLMTCRLGSKTLAGDFKMTFKAFANPNSDSNTPGKVLIEKMVWKQGEGEGKKL